MRGSRDAPARLGAFARQPRVGVAGSGGREPRGPGHRPLPPFTLTAVSREADRDCGGRPRLERWRDALLAAKTDEELLLGEALVGLRSRLAPARPPGRTHGGRGGLRELTEKLESLVKEMESDPAGDPWLAAEHRAAAEDLRGAPGGSFAEGRAGASRAPKGTKPRALWMKPSSGSWARIASASEEAQRSRAEPALWPSRTRMRRRLKGTVGRIGEEEPLGRGPSQNGRRHGQRSPTGCVAWPRACERRRASCPTRRPARTHPGCSR